MELKYQIMLAIAVMLTVTNILAFIIFARREGADSFDGYWHGYTSIYYPLGLYSVQALFIIILDSAARSHGAGYNVGAAFDSGGIPLLLFNMLVPLAARYLIYRHRMDKAAQSVELEA